MPFTIQPRRALMVYLYSMKQVRQLKRYGLLSYQSRRMRYAVLYLNEDQVAKTTAKLKQLNFVKKVIPSYRPDIAMNFGERVDHGFFKPQEDDME